MAPEFRGIVLVKLPPPWKSVILEMQALEFVEFAVMVWFGLVWFGSVRMSACNINWHGRKHDICFRTEARLCCKT